MIEARAEGEFGTMIWVPPEHIQAGMLASPPEAREQVLGELGSALGQYGHLLLAGVYAYDSQLFRRLCKTLNQVAAHERELLEARLEEER